MKFAQTGGVQGGSLSIGLSGLNGSAIVNTGLFGLCWYRVTLSGLDKRDVREMKTLRGG